MTLNGAIKQLHELRLADDMPIYYKPVIAEVINVLLTDTQEIKHGRWIKLFETENDITARCSECRMVYTLGKGRDPNYCGTCGAKMDEDNIETLEAWDLDGSPTRYIRGQREDKTQDCETCQSRKTCKDAPIPSCYACLGYEPTEAST